MGSPEKAGGFPERRRTNRHANLILLVLENLIHHALKVSPRNGSVSVCFQAGNTGVDCEVSDQGPGIAPEILPRLFTPCRSTQGGSGLGLADTYANENKRPIAGKLETGAGLSSGAGVGDGVGACGPSRPFSWEPAPSPSAPNHGRASEAVVCIQRVSRVQPAGQLAGGSGRTGFARGSLQPFQRRLLKLAAAGFMDSTWPSAQPRLPRPRWREERNEAYS